MVLPLSNIYIYIVPQLAHPRKKMLTPPLLYTHTVDFYSASIFFSYYLFIFLYKLSIYILNNANNKWQPCSTPFSILGLPIYYYFLFLISVALPILLPLKLILTGLRILKRSGRSALSKAFSKSTSATYDSLLYTIFPTLVLRRCIRRG